MGQGSSLATFFPVCELTGIKSLGELVVVAGDGVAGPVVDNEVVPHVISETIKPTRAEAGTE